MTAIGPAPAHALNVPSPAHASRQGAGDRFAFAAVLDSLPRTEATAGPAVAKDEAAPSGEHEAKQPPPDLRAALVDSALMSSVAFAAPSASAPGESPAGSNGGTTLGATPKQTPEAEN